MCDVYIYVCVSPAVYRPHCERQRREMERIQREDGLSLPQDLDYLSLPVGLSQEVREVLDRARPSTVRGTRLNTSPSFTGQIHQHATLYIHNSLAMVLLPVSPYLLYSSAVCSVFSWVQQAVCPA